MIFLHFGLQTRNLSSPWGGVSSAALEGDTISPGTGVLFCPPLPRDTPHVPELDFPTGHGSQREKYAGSAVIDHPSLERVGVGARGAVIFSFLDCSSKSTMSGQNHHDLATMARLDEESMMRALQARYAKDMIYTYVGDILVAINPYQDLGIYGSQEQRQYRQVGYGL